MTLSVILYQHPTVAVIKKLFCKDQQSFIFAACLKTQLFSDNATSDLIDIVE